MQHSLPNDCWIALPLPPGVFGPPVVAPVLSIMHDFGFCCSDAPIHIANQTNCKDHWLNDLPYPSYYDSLAVQIIASNE